MSVGTARRRLLLGPSAAVAVGLNQALLQILKQAPTPLAGSQLAVPSSRSLSDGGSSVSSRGVPDARSRMAGVLSLGPRRDVALDLRLPESECDALLAGVTEWTVVRAESSDVELMRCVLDRN